MIAKIQLQNEDVLKQLFYADDPFAIKIWGDYQSYGLAYDFCTFYHFKSQECEAVIGNFYGDVWIYCPNKMVYSSELKRFLKMLPLVQSVTAPYSEEMENMLKDFSCQQAEVLVRMCDDDEYDVGICQKPSLRASFDILKASDNVFRELSEFEGYYTDIMHRMKKGTWRQLTFLETSTQTAATGAVMGMNQKAMLIGQVAVHPNNRGRGYSSILIDNLLRDKEIKKGYVLARLPDLTVFYQKIGFTAIQSYIKGIVKK